MFSKEYSVRTSSFTILQINNEEVSEEDIGIAVEEKTGKIISLDFSKNFFREDTTVKEKLENYAKYLDLDIIGDWEYENGTLKSTKAQLYIMLEELDSGYMLTITPNDVYEEYKKVLQEYEIVEKEKTKKE